ncbi:MAG: amino acid adenylation domain-containing protein [Coleofasciculus sp. G1-WW12-02]|uniref:amino acid adenylation domain-containing protein n=1 Tax=Coleofasciculus sp. G1-WW12-02 TaxID=3068483 RepID=UPI0032F260E2
MQGVSIEGFRLSPQQKHLWLLQQGVNSQPYRVQCAVLIEGTINTLLLESALQKVLEKYEILRTNFQALPGMNVPLQVITANRLPTLHYHDFTDLDPEKQYSQIEALFNEKNQLCFDFEKGDVLDSSLVILAANKQMLLVSLPGLNSDVVSVENFVREISCFYAADLQNQEWVDQPLQYVDIAEWQNELFAGEEVEIGKKYWQTKDLSGLANWQLPQENMPAQKRGFEPKFISVGLTSENVLNLDTIAQNYNTSISVMLQACWAILLWRLTGRSNVIIGTYFDGRNYEELEPTLGLLAKYLPIDSHLDDTTPLSDVLNQIDESTHNAWKWQEAFNWEQVAGVTEQNLGSCFFPYSFEFREQFGQYIGADVSFSIDQQYACIEPFKVKLSCRKRNDTLVTEFHYNANLFHREDIERLARYFQTLLTSVIAKPDVTIGELEILSPSDRYQLLVEFNNTKTDYSKQLCIHQFIEQQAGETPDRIAVSIENQQLTYAQLNTRANQLAHHLQSLGVSAETVVALCVERSLDMIVGVLGILKAGGAYLPIDPIVPRDRITFMVQDAQASVILTQQHLVEHFCAETATLLCLDADWQTIAQQPEETPPCPAMPENLVYVIYTSGSTGKPKGVAVEHRQLVNYLHGILARLDVPQGANFATVSTLAADLGNTAIFGALCTGGCLHIISQERATSPEAFIEYCDSHPIDCLKIVPSHLNALLTASHPEKILPRKYLILGGEVLSLQLVEKIQQYAPTCQILNHYGPTETTVGVLTYPVHQRIRDKSKTVPIGCAIANTQIYILDHYLQPVPIGVPGELYIGGDNVARGYVNQPQLTAERFITIEHLGGEDVPPKRVYKTGDLARYLPDGNIEFLGRIDHQVKIHGFRIELGEIESVLNQHPAIREAVVLAQEDELSHKRLVAYIVPSQESVLISELRDVLKQKLPDYMIPSAFVPLKALPLTPNGKVDRQGLPNPDSVKPEIEGRFVPPRTPVEKTIAEIWAQVLGRDRISIYDNFFELGGDSILSIQIVSRANQAGLQLTPPQLFESPTIAGLAAVAGTTATIKAQQEPVTGEIPLTPIQHWFFEQKLDDMHHWNQALLLEVRQSIRPELLQQTVQHLMEHHDALRLRFTSTASGWQQVNAGLDGIESVPLSEIDLSGIPAAEQESILETTASELQASLNLAEGLILRVALFHLGDNQSNRLLIVIHHLAVDGISWRILLEDLEQIYQQLSQGEAVQRPAKTYSFQQWSESLQDYARSEQLQQERNYWLTTSDYSGLPIEYPKGANTVGSAETVSVALNVEETRALLQEVPLAYQTQINDVLLTALVQTFAEWTQEPFLLLDLEGHGREAIDKDIDVSRTVGWFTTIFPVLLTLEGISQPGEALKAIKEQLRGIPNRGIGYGVLRYLSEDAEVIQKLSSLPQAEVRFNYLGQFDQILSESRLFELVYPTPGISRSPQGNRRYLIDVNGFVLGGQLQLEWTYSQQIHQRITIEQLAQGFVEALQALIAHCQSAEAGGYTPSDFQKANVSQKDLNRLLGQIR